MIYKHFTFQESNQTLTRFVKVENDIVWRKHQSMNSNISNKNSFRYPQIHVYENISDRKGVFITGHRFFFKKNFNLFYIDFFFFYKKKTYLDFHRKTIYTFSSNVF